LASCNAPSGRPIDRIQFIESNLPFPPRGGRLVKQLGVGVIGVGFIGREHLHALTVLSREGAIQASLAALCDVNRQRLERANSEFGPASCYQDYRELLEDPAVDVVYVCTPTKWHPEIVEAAVAAGKPLFCEKPLARDFTTVRRLCRTVKKSGLQAQVGLVLRFYAHLLYLRRLHRESPHGRLLAVHLRDDQQFPVGAYYGSTWRANPEIAGAGVLLEHSIHDVDLLRWIYGEVDWVYADVTHIGGHAVEDQATVLLHMKEGAVCSLTTVWHRVYRPSERLIQVFYEDAYIALTLETFRQRLDIQIGERPTRTIPDEELVTVLLEEIGLHGFSTTKDQARELVSRGRMGHFAQAWSFIQSIAEGHPCSPSFEEALRAHELVEAAYQSSQRRTPIHLPLTQ